MIVSASAKPYSRVCPKSKFVNNFIAPIVVSVSDMERMVSPLGYTTQGSRLLRATGIWLDAELSARWWRARRA
jgi:hypothetical protein